ncbi:MAG: type II toxin-antitoxin system Phd/YefM family antitoxin [Anaerolinea sp.]|nr:type II toxin-antitoxin system Phd/YefM family antitoxin [Anaerolinea sp.]
MQSSVISIARAREGFSDLVNRAAFGGERFVVERRGKPLAALVGAEEYQQVMSLLSQTGVQTMFRSIPVRIRFDGDRYFIDDEIVDLYGAGATLAEAQNDYWMTVQEAYADLAANESHLAPHLQKQLEFLKKVVVAQGGDNP